jgi:hypothetical protein
MSENIDDSGIQPVFSYRSRLLSALFGGKTADRKPDSLPLEHERMLLDSDPYLTKLTRRDDD